MEVINTNDVAYKKMLRNKKRREAYAIQKATMTESDLTRLREKRHAYYLKRSDASHVAILQRAKMLNDSTQDNASNRYKRWSEAEDCYLRDNYTQYTPIQLAILLHRSLASVERRLFRLHLYRRGPLCS